MFFWMPDPVENGHSQGSNLSFVTNTFGSGYCLVAPKIRALQLIADFEGTTRGMDD